MLQNDDGTYTGFIKVHLKLRRPVTVPAGIRPQSIYDALKEVNLADMTDKRTSFYLPLDAIKQLHISSTTTVSEVIQGLLKKFMVVDNPQKFALFKEMRKDGQGEFTPSEPPAFRGLMGFACYVVIQKHGESIPPGLSGVAGRLWLRFRWINGLTSSRGDDAKVNRELLIIRNGLKSCKTEQIVIDLCWMLSCFCYVPEQYEPLL